MSITALDHAYTDYQTSLARLVEQHLKTIEAEVEQHHAQVRAELVAHAASAETVVTEAIENCLGFHYGERCDTDPNECLDVQVAIAAADAAAMMLAAWLIAAGTGTFTPRDEEQALDVAFHLIAEASAIEATVNHEGLTWDEVLQSHAAMEGR